MKTAKGWRQLKKEEFPVHDGKVTKEKLYEYLQEVFHEYRERKEVRMEYTTFVNENGVEMVQVLAPCGILQTTAENWQKHMEEVCKPYITLDPSYFKPNSEPVTQTKLTLNHGIEVTITYDGDDTQTAE